MNGLLDEATVVVGDGNWRLGWQEDGRDCGTTVYLADICDPNPASGNVLGDPASRPAPYWVRPFGIVGHVNRSFGCSQDDDESYIREATKEAAEQAIGLAICVEHQTGTDTWIGGSQVGSVPVSTTLAEAVPAGREAWFKTAAGMPVLHVAPGNLIELINAGVVIRDEGTLTTVWGDKVVSSPGYLTGAVFWAGDITVYLSGIDVTTLIQTSKNDSVVQADQNAAIDVAPCSIIRIGDVPTNPDPYVAT